ncbi:TMEM175 family protein [Actinopolymorpha alba]|uniref:TMEM175 family protein n=1 Tax=Actinopolymorpha alba TaxID=533267 RepID=UPI00035DBAE4|nr:TMEM175 family protein [Actinopolymorpha alba]
MPTSRLEAFSDGVLAIIITIMVLELKVPEHADLAALRQTTGTALLTYLLSFVYIGIYWNNHHHMFQLVEKVSGGVLWANLHLLFWLSLFPLTTAWMDDTSYARTPVVVYGVNLLAAGLAWFLLQTTIIRAEGAASVLRQALGGDWKGKLSPGGYLLGIASAWLSVPLAMAFYVVVALAWLIPDRRFERAMRAIREASERPGGPPSSEG